MKKFLQFSFILAFALCFSNNTKAQADLSVSLLEPMAGFQILAGQSFTTRFQVTNAGNTTITTTDSIIYQPTLNNSSLVDSLGNVFIFFFNPLVDMAPGASETRSFNIRLTLTNPIPNFDWCMNVSGRGPSFANPDPTPSNNRACNNVTYSDPTMGIFDGGYTVDFNNIIDNSFYNNGIYNLRIGNAKEVKNPVLTVYDLLGKEIYKVAVNKTDFENIQEKVNLSHLNNGLYVISINDGLRRLSSKKVLVD